MCVWDRLSGLEKERDRVMRKYRQRLHAVWVWHLYAYMRTFEFVRKRRTQTSWVRQNAQACRCIPRQNIRNIFAALCTGWRKIVYSVDRRRSKIQNGSYEKYSLDRRRCRPRCGCCFRLPVIYTHITKFAHVLCKWKCKMFAIILCVHTLWQCVHLCLCMRQRRKPEPHRNRAASTCIEIKREKKQRLQQ